MPTNMLIDAAHPEETRVVVVRDSKVEEFDFEAASRRQLRGNIYLAKVTRVEPSLQAAFVDYGGNRHGFLAFSEIHPDYYQIPQADRQALIDQEAAEAAEADADAGEDVRRSDALVADGSENGDESEDDTVESVGGDDALEEADRPKPQRPRRNYKIQEVIKKRQILLVQVVKEERGNKGAALTTYLSLAGRYAVLMPNTARGGGISRKITSAGDRKRLKEIAGDLEVPTGMGVILRTAGASRTKAEIKRDFEYLLRLWENVRELTLKSIAPTLVYEEGNLVKRAIRDLYTKDIDQVLVAGEAAYREAKDFMRMLMPSHAKNVQQYRDEQPIFSRNNVEAQLDAMFSPVVTLRSGGYIVLSQTEALVAIDVNSGRSTREHNIEDTALKTNLEAADEVARQLRLRDLAGLIVIDFIDMDEKRNNRAVEKRLKDALRNDRARIQVGRISHFGLMEMSRQRIRTGVVESSMSPCPVCHGTGHVRSVESVALHVLRSIESELLKGTPTDLLVRTGQDAALYILNQKREHLREIEQRFGIRIDFQVEEPTPGTLFRFEKGEPGRGPARSVVDPSSVEMAEIEEAPALAESESESDGEAAESGEDGAGGGRRRRRRRRRGRGGDSAERGEAGRDTAAEADAETAQPEEADSESERGSDDEEGDGQGGRRRRRGRRGGRRHRRDDQPTAAEAGESGGGSEDETAAQGDESATAPAATESAPTDADASTHRAEEHAEGEAAGSQAKDEAVTAVEEAAAEEAPAKPKRRRAPRRSRKSAADTAETAAAEEAKAPEAPAAGEAEPAAEAAAPEPEPQPEPEPVAAAPAEPEAEETAEAPAEEAPAAEEVAPVDGSGQREEAMSGGEAETETEAPANEPPRRGWWQRRKLFGN